jgi:hypothetical protein
MFMIWEFIVAVVVAFVGGAAGAAIINGINERKMHKLKRQDAKEDNEALETEKRLKAIEAKTDAQSEALKFILYDRIRYLGQAYIAESEIDFDDRRILNDMHRSYHSGLGGNGDLDKLMEAVNDLPLKSR